MDTLSLVSIVASVGAALTVIATSMLWLKNAIREAIVAERELSQKTYAPLIAHVELQAELKATREAVHHLTDRINKLLEKSNA